jgi:DNA-directed RNA polymerase specialized sigma24 family protein
MYLRLQYRWAPGRYLAEAYSHWEEENPKYMVDCSRALGELEALLPHGWWPLVLYKDAKIYVANGGRAVKDYGGTSDYEDALLRHVAEQGNKPGPIWDSLVAFREVHDAALEVVHHSSELKRTLAPILKRNLRLAGLLDLDDLVQEAVSASAEAAKDPLIDWKIGRHWATSSIGPTRAFLRRVVERLASRRYGADRQTERVKEYLEDTIPNTEDALDSVEWQMMLSQVMDTLPPKQQEAVQVQHRAIIDGVSLEEKSRELGRDPHRDRENFKAVQRRYHDKALTDD